MRAFVVLLAALVVASCAFESDRPLFGPEGAVTPIQDGAVFDWRTSDGEALRVRFVRSGNGYQFSDLTRPNEAPMQVQFAPVIETRDDDYIAQVALETSDGDGYAYAFLWPRGDGRYRVIVQPGAFGAASGEGAQYCTPAAYGACTFTSVEQIRRYYREVLYPQLASGHMPARYLDLTPVADGEGKPRDR